MPLISHTNLSQEQGKPRWLVLPDSHTPTHPSCLTGRRNSLGPLEHLDLLTDSLLSSPKFNLEAVRSRAESLSIHQTQAGSLARGTGLFWTFLSGCRSQTLCPQCPLGVGRAFPCPVLTPSSRGRGSLAGLGGWGAQTQPLSSPEPLLLGQGAGGGSGGPSVAPQSQHRGLRFLWL